MSEPESRRSYGIKETYVTPLNQRLMSVQKALENYDSALGVVDALNKELILITSLTKDLKAKFKADIEKLNTLLFDTPARASGVTRALRQEHAIQILQVEGLQNRKYAVNLFSRITDALDEKGWLDKVMRDIPRNF